MTLKDCFGKNTDSTQILLVEGKTDCHVVRALCKAYKLPETFSITECGSDNEAIEIMRAMAANPRYSSLGLILDADEIGVASRWQTIRSMFRLIDGIKLQEEPSLSGTIIPRQPPRFPRLGFWFMPNNRDCGRLEDFCLELADPGSRVVADEAVGLAENKGATRFNPIHRSKAVVHTYLAWQEEPGKPLGQALSANYLFSKAPRPSPSWNGSGNCSPIQLSPIEFALFSPHHGFTVSSRYES